MTRATILATVMLITLSEAVAASSAKVRHHHSSRVSAISQSTDLSTTDNSIGFAAASTPDDHYHGAPHYHGGPKSIY